MADREVEKRLAAVLAADIAGYTRMMEEDTDGTVFAWHAARSDVIDPGIAQFRGRIVKHTGDGFLAEFSTALDAVNCAISLQEGLSSSILQFRMGVNLGDIVDDGEDIHGEGVNVAARLEGLADPGGICISGEAHALVRNRIQSPFRDLGEHEVKHVTYPVRVYAFGLAHRPDKVDQPGRAIDVKPSIAVLPFDNLSDDPEQEYFSDGMAEDLITDLSKIERLSVAARNSSFHFKGRMPDLQEVASTLSVTYVLEGSVRKMGDRLRINAQLIDGRDGKHVWAERYDGQMTEIFEFQDRIQAEIVAALSVRLTPADATLMETRSTNNLEAYDFCLRGRSEYYRYTPQNFAEARRYFEQAIKADPTYAEAYGYLSYCLTTMYVFNWPGAEESLDHALELAEKSLTLDPRSSVAHSRLGWVLGFYGEFERAVENFERAITLDPRDAGAFYAYGETLNRSGADVSDKAIDLIERAIRLEVFPSPGWEFGIGHSLALSKKFEEAVSRFQRVLDRLPQLVPAHVQLIRTYSEMGRLADASKAVKTLQEISPKYTIRTAERMFPYADESNRQRLQDNLLKAGMPEG